MASKKQIEANRRNAKKSPGPKSPTGKEVVRMNALKYGLRAEHVVLPGEDPEEFDAFVQSFDERYQPVGPDEKLLVKRIASTYWRLQRFSALESAIMRWEHFYLERKRAKEDMKRASEEMDRHRPAGDSDYDGLDWLEYDEVADVPAEQQETVAEPLEVEKPDRSQPERPYETDEPEVPEEYAKAVRAYEKAEEALARADRELRAPFCNRALVFRGSWVLLEKLSRYETTLERRLRNLTQDLERLQTARKAEAAAAAKVIDAIELKEEAG